MSSCIQIERIRVWDILAITRMVYANMIGVDVDFTELTRTPFRRALSYLFVPVYLLTAGEGFKARHEGEIAGCGYYHLRRLSGFVFNVGVAEAHRRHGIATNLMQHLELQIWQSGRRWVGLHVDRDNMPAQRLYQHLDYQPYHPYFLRSPGATTPWLGAGELPFEPLPRRTGSHRFRAFQRREREAGDAWAAAVVEADFGNSVPSGGRFWSVQEKGNEIASLWLGDAGGVRQAILALDPTYWDREDIRERIYSGILAADGNAAGALEVYLGSSAHYEAALAHWRALGFVARRRARILMLKQLQRQP
jgi:ribosomal protein S18 acetylase RimI-like enzyme